MNTSTLSLTIQLPKFEGPLALLLYLIRKDEMDIFDIEIHRITAQYLEFIRMMKELDLEVAGEFVAMASTLIQIKSRMLLPQYDENGEVLENAEDPRKELVQRLLEYQKYQEAAKGLYERPILGRDFWGRGLREKFEERIQEEIELEENALFSLISSYRRAFRAAQKRIHKVTAKAQSIASRILEMKDRLIVGTRIGLSELVTATGREKRVQLLITFLASLELGKMGFVRLFQSDNYQEIHIETMKPIETAAVSKVEEYESLHNEEGDGAQNLTPLTYDSVGDATPTEAAASQAQLEFELRDSDEETADLEVPLFTEEDMASDDEILAAERELTGETTVTAEVQAEEPVIETAAALEIQPEAPYVMEYEMPEAEFVVSEAEEAALEQTLAEETQLEVNADVSAETSEGIELADAEVVPETELIESVNEGKDVEV